MADNDNKPYYVYILRCRDDSLYIGMTPDLMKRMKAHCGRIKGGAKYTRSHPVTEIAAAWRTEGKIPAARMEYALKNRLTRQDKLRLVSEPELLCRSYVLDMDEYPFESVDRQRLDDVFSAAAEVSV